MEKKFYNADSLERSLLVFERKFGVSSHDFYETISNGDRIEGMPGFTRSLWASLYRDYCRPRSDSFAVAVERTLQPV